MKSIAINRWTNSTDKGSVTGNHGKWRSMLALLAVMLLMVAGIVVLAGSADAKSGGLYAPTQDAKGSSAGDSAGSQPDCGPNWAIVSSPNISAQPGTQNTQSSIPSSSHPDGAFVYPKELWGVSVVSSNDIWAVGDGPSASLSDEQATVTEHWNGTAWSDVTSPGSGPGVNTLKSVAAASTHDVWAVGSLIEHWNGSAWSFSTPANVAGSFAGVAVVSANDVWAVGYYIDGTTQKTLTEHWNGTAWSHVASPNAGPGTGPIGLNSVAVVSANDVWAVGSYQNSSNVYKTLVEHWNGTAWSISPSANKGNDDNILNAVAVVSTNNVWAVGYYRSNNNDMTLTEKWDGTSWTVVPSPNPVTGYDNLQGLAVVEAGDIWAVGADTTSLNSRTLVEHWNGSNWSIVSSPNGGPNNDYLGGIAVSSSNDLWAVGGDVTSNSGGDTLVERYNTCVTVTPTTTPIAACPIQYTDVPSGSTFYAYVHCLACRGIVSGYSDNTFRPNNSVNRWQLSKMVSNSAGYSEKHITADFVDVPVGSAFHEYVERLASRGYISGYACGAPGEPCPGTYFRPNAVVSRGQTSKIVATAKGLPAPPPGQQTFEDVLHSNTFWQWIEALASTGAIQGYACGLIPDDPCVPPGNRPYFRPNAPVSRGQAAKIVEITFFPNCVGLAQ